MIKKSITLIGLIAINYSQANTLTVGTDTNCGYATIQAALNDSLPNDTVNVAAETFTGADAQVSILKSVTLNGGLNSDCNGFSANRTVLQANIANAVMSIDVSNNASVTISGFDISGSQPNVITPHTSGVAITGNGSVTIENTLIHDNLASKGGGISAINGSSVFLQNNVEIYNNEATSQGGGIYCNNCSLFAVETAIGKFENGVDLGNFVSAVDGQGGGIYMEMASDSFIGKSPSGNGAVSISYNKSDLGSAIYLNSSNLSSTHKGNTITNNEGQTKESQGAAAFLAGNAVFSMTNNKAIANIGTSIFKVTDDARFDIVSENNDCPNAVCAEVSSGNSSFIFRTLNNGNINIDRVKFDNNNGSFALGESINDNGITASNSIISNQQITGSNYLFTTSSGAPTMTFTNLTVVNSSGTAIFNPGANNKIIFDGGIIWNNTFSDLSTLTNIGNLDIKNTIMQFDPTAFVNTLQVDPLMVDVNNGNYYLQANSPAIDYFTGTTIEDIQGVARPQGSAHDAGAYEWSDLIFANGFELN